MTREEHRDQAKARIGYSDQSWQEASDLGSALGSVRQAVVALTEAVLALSAPEQVEVGGQWPTGLNYHATGGKP